MEIDVLRSSTRAHLRCSLLLWLLYLTPYDTIVLRHCEIKTMVPGIRFLTYLLIAVLHYYFGGHTNCCLELLNSHSWLEQFHGQFYALSEMQSFKKGSVPLKG